MLPSIIHSDTGLFLNDIYITPRKQPFQDKTQTLCVAYKASSTTWLLPNCPSTIPHPGHVEFLAVPLNIKLIHGSVPLQVLLSLPRVLSFIMSNAWSLPVMHESTPRILPLKTLLEPTRCTSCPGWAGMLFLYPPRAFPTYLHCLHTSCCVL